MMNPPNHLVGSRIKRTQVCHLADLLRSKPGFLQVRPMMERQVLQKTLAGSGRSVAASAVQNRQSRSVAIELLPNLQIFFVVDSFYHASEGQTSLRFS
jgi:hypothetical protein